MSSILDQVVTVGVESTYGTAQTSTVRSYEAKADTFQRDVEYIERRTAVRRRVETRNVHRISRQLVAYAVS